VEELVLALLLLSERLPVCALVGGKRAPLLADELREVRLTSLLGPWLRVIDDSGSALRPLGMSVVFDTFPTEQDECVLWPLYVVFITLPGTTLAIGVDFERTASGLAALNRSATID
jgi:hypothetical protein